MTSRLAAIAFVALVAACGSKGKGDAAGGGEAGLASCDSPKFKECKQYSKANRALGDDLLQKLCGNFEGTFATTGCPTAGRAGACVKQEGTTIFYAGHLMAVADAESMCTSTGGTWQKP